MKLEIKHLGQLILSDSTLEKMTAEVRDEYEIFLDSHLKCVRDFLPDGFEYQQGIHNHLVGYVDGKIVAFRYFFYNSGVCELFNTYVDSNHRQKHVATSLIEESIAFAEKQGIKKFVVRMASENEERDALFEKYKEIVQRYLNGNQFTIYYAAKEFVFN